MAARRSPAKLQLDWTKAFLRVAHRDKYARDTILLAMALTELHHNRTTGQLDPGYPLLAAEIGCSKKSIQRGVKQLTQAGWIKTRKAGPKDTLEFTLLIPPESERTPDVPSVSGHQMSPQRVDNVRSRGDMNRRLRGHESTFEGTSDVHANEHLNTINTIPLSSRAGACPVDMLPAPAKEFDRAMDGLTKIVGADPKIIGKAWALTVSLTEAEAAKIVRDASRSADPLAVIERRPRPILQPCPPPLRPWEREGIEKIKARQREMRLCAASS